MKVIITFTFCCDNLRKSKFLALGKPVYLGIFFLLVSTLSFGHVCLPVIARTCPLNKKYFGTVV